MIINCRGENLTLNKERAIYWATKKMLIISDMHIGKSAHFRRSGIQVPDTIGLTDLQRLTSLIEEYSPDTLLITGDMFHHKINSDTIAFIQWRQKHVKVDIILIKGNHDTLTQEDYSTLGITVHQKELLTFPFRFIHDKPNESDEYYNISGHIHPGVALYGKAKQQLKFPCFYFGNTFSILPAFSVFTGLKILRPDEGDRIYAITPAKVIQV